jgi:hypothetical protein
VNTVLTRREFAALTGASLLARRAVAQTESLLMRAIPSSGELVPAVGLGTARIFDNANEATRAKAAAVVQALVANGGRIIDTASTYGDAEIVMGAEIAGSNLRDKVFVATKLESPDPSELRRSLNRLKTAKVDLLQLHNVQKQSQSLAKFKEWKSQGMPLHRRDIDFPQRLSGGRGSASGEARFCSDRLFARCPRGRETYSPPGSRREGRRIDGDTIWQRRTVPRGARPDDS